MKLVASPAQPSPGLRRLQTHVGSLSGLVVVVVVFPPQACKFYLKGSSLSFQLLPQLSDKKQTQSVITALPGAPRAPGASHTKAGRPSKHLSSGVWPETKVQVGRRLCETQHWLWHLPRAHSFCCVPYARSVATAWLCLAFWQTGLESQQTLQTT